MSGFLCALRFYFPHSHRWMELESVRVDLYKGRSRPHGQSYYWISSIFNSSFDFIVRTHIGGVHGNGRK